MPYTVAGKNLMLDALEPDHVSLHTAEPNASGSNEVTGGEYARQAIDWNDAKDGAKDDKSNGIPVPVPGETTVKFLGYWKEGAFVAFDPVDNETFNKAGTYTVTDADLDLLAA
jgi:hypothetical protein